MVLSIAYFGFDDFNTYKRNSWLVAYLVSFMFIGFIQPLLPNDNLFADGLFTIFLVLNLGLASIIIFLILRYFINQMNFTYSLLAVEREKSDRLLLNVLPQEITQHLKDEGGTITNGYDDISVLFADVVSFTPLSEILIPGESFEVLDEIFSYFDPWADKHDLEKIRTIGDGYIVIGGGRGPRRIMPMPSQR